MASNVSRGADAKGKTKKFLEKRGYVVFDMEIVRTIWQKDEAGRMRPKFAVKRDQLGADLGAMGHNVTIICQVKSGDAAKGGTFPAARREFALYPHPEGVRKIIIGWPPQSRVPRLMEVFGDGTFTEVQAV